VTRLASELIVAGMLVGAIVLGSAAAPANASGTDVCSLLTRPEASKILGAKVVATSRKSQASNGAQECTYKTKKFTDKRFKQLKAPLELGLTWQPMSVTLRSNIDSNRSKLNPIAGLGDEAYVINDFDVFAIQGHNVVQSKIYNWDTGVGTLESKNEQAVRTAVPRLPTG
jgi:hypothetical protein